MPYNLKIWFVQQVQDILFATCIKIVKAYYFTAKMQDLLTQIGADEPRASRDKENTFLRKAQMRISHW